MNIKNLLLGIAVLIIVGIGGFVYRNAVEHPQQAVACPVNYFQCPDGTQVPHLAGSCDFPACPPPNVSLADSNVAFALPDGFSATTLPDAASIAAYANAINASTTGTIVIRRFSINASSTALATIQQTAISGTSGEPVPATSLSSVFLGGENFTLAPIERFEGTVDTAYYLSRGNDVLRFDAIDTNVTDWTGDGLDITRLPANAALRKLLTTLE